MKVILRLAFALALLGLYSVPASAQYMFLDANGDGVYNADTDKLNSNGTATTVDVYLVTNQNRDGSTAVCDVDGTSPLSINSYVINLEAAGGTVTYANFINDMGASFSTNFGELNAGDGGYKNGYGAQTPVQPGKYKVATITITGTSGAPSINIVDQIATSSDYTSFGTGAGGCVGHDFDSTYKLSGPKGGTDWTDVDGLGPAPGGNAAPTLTVAQNVTAIEGQLLTIEATATDPNPNDTITISQTSTAPFLTNFASTPGHSPVTATLAGTPAVGGSGVYLVTWVASDNVNPPDTVVTTVTVTPAGTNNCPVLSAIGDKTVTELTDLTFTAVATDADAGQEITYSLGAGAPPGASIDVHTGFFTWTPTDAQGPGTYAILVQATDNSTQPCTDSETINVTVLDQGAGSNQCPVLASIGNKTVTEGELLTFTATATDPDAGQTLTFSLDPGFPAGATINSSTGVFAWTPAVDQGPATLPITVRVTDNGNPSCSDSEDILVTVNDSAGGNQCPVLTAIGDKTVTEGNMLTFTAMATDPNSGQVLTFSLGGTIPTGATINSSTGVFSWTPTSDQGPGTYPVVVRVTDNGTPACTDSETVTVTVNDSGGGNQCPVLSAIGNRTVTVGNLLTFTAAATDPDAGQTLTFSLDPGFPTGASINSSTGVFTFTPTADQAGTQMVTVRVTDNADPSCSDFETISITVNPAAGNNCPVLTPIGNKTVTEGQLLTFTAAATDADAGQTLTFSLDPGFPTGASINSSTGVFTFTPTSGQVGTQTVTVRVTDNANPSCSDFETITILVNEAGENCPVLTSIGNRTVTEGQLLTFTATATSPDNFPVIFSLDAGAPTGASINPTTGVFSFTPTLDQGPGTYTITVRATTACANPCSDTETITVTVLDSGSQNSCPVLNVIGNRTVTVGSQLSFVATATDADAGQVLTFSLDPGAPTGASINSSTGAFTWTPSAGTTPGTFPITVRVTDNADPSCSDFESIVVTVNPAQNQCPVLDAIGNHTVNEGQLLTFTAHAVDPDGQIVIYSLDTGAPSGAMIDPITGVFTWTPNGTQGTNTYPITVRATDACNNPCSDFETIQVTVNDVAGQNNCPVLSSIGNRTITEGNMLSFTATATDADAGRTLTFSLDPGAPSGTSINSSTGAFTWTPTSDQGPGTFSITVRVTDNADPSCSDFETIQVTVNDAQNQCPILSSIGNRTVTEGQLLTFTATATDPDGHPVIFSLDSGAPAGAMIDPFTGIFSFTPTSAQGPNTYNVTVRVTDACANPCSDFETIQITVLDAGGSNACPVLTTIGNRTVTQGSQLTFTATATDADAGQTLTFSLDPGAPQGATINSSTGAFTWTPTSSGAFAMTVRVTDNGNPSCSDFETIQVSVTGENGNSCPVLNAIGDRTINEGSEMNFTATATDADAGQTLTFSLDPGAPSGATIGSNTGNFTWTPVGAGTFPITVRVTDNASTPCSDSETIMVTVLSSGGSTFRVSAFFQGGDKTTRLWTGKAHTCLRVEVVGTGVDASMIDLNTLVLTYNGQDIRPISTDLSRDANRDGNDELEACFSKQDLRMLFDGLPSGENTVTLVLSGQLTTGQPFSTSVDHEVVVREAQIGRGGDHGQSGDHGNSGDKGNGGDKGNVGNQGNGGGDDQGEDDDNTDVADNSGNGQGQGQGNGNGHGNGGNDKGNGHGHHALAKPNPLNPSTVLEFSVAKTGPVRVQIFNAAGRLVKALYEGTLQEGRNTLGWDGSTSTGSRVASGMYYFRIVTAETSEVVRVTVLK